MAHFDIWADLEKKWNQIYADSLAHSISHRDLGYRAFLLEGFVWYQLKQTNDTYWAVRGWESSQCDFALIDPLRGGSVQFPAEVEALRWALARQGQLRCLTVDAKEVTSYERQLWGNEASVFIVSLTDVFPRALHLLPGDLAGSVEVFGQPDSMAPLAVQQDRLLETMVALVKYAKSGSTEGFVNPTTGVRMTGWEVSLIPFSGEDMDAPRGSIKTSMTTLVQLRDAITRLAIPKFRYHNLPIAPLVGDFMLEVGNDFLVMEHKAYDPRVILRRDGTLAWERLSTLDRVLYGLYHFLIVQSPDKNKVDLVCICHADIIRTGGQVRVREGGLVRCLKTADVPKLYTFLVENASRSEQYLQSLQMGAVRPVEPKKPLEKVPKPIHVREKVDVSMRGRVDRARWLAYCLNAEFAYHGELLCYHLIPPSFAGCFTQLVFVTHIWDKQEMTDFNNFGRLPFVSLGETPLQGRTAANMRVVESEADQVLRSKDEKGRYKHPLSFHRFETRRPPGAVPNIILALPDLLGRERGDGSHLTISYTVVPDEFFKSTIGGDTLDFSTREIPRIFDTDGRGDCFLATPDVHIEKHQLGFHQLFPLLKKILTTEESSVSVPSTQSRKPNPPFDPGRYRTTVKELLQKTWDNRMWKPPARVSAFTKAQYKDVIAWEKQKASRLEILYRLRQLHDLNINQDDLRRMLTAGKKDEFLLP